MSRSRLIARQLSLMGRFFDLRCFWSELASGRAPSGSGADCRQLGVNLGQTVFSQVVDRLPRYEFLIFKIYSALFYVRPVASNASDSVGHSIFSSKNEPGESVSDMRVSFL